MARYNYKASTRMEKIEGTLQNVALAPGSVIELPFQLEGGDEECQVKRLVLSAASDQNCQYELYLGDEAMAGPQPIQRLISNFVSNGSGMINQTTTIRVPRDWHLLVRVTNVGGVPGSFAGQVTLHYKVLS